MENPIYDKTNNIYSLYLAKEYLMEEDTLLIESDLIIEEKVLSRLLAHPYPNLAVVSKYQSWMDGTVVSLDEDDNIMSFIAKRTFASRISHHILKQLIYINSVKNFLKFIMFLF